MKSYVYYFSALAFLTFIVVSSPSVRGQHSVPEFTSNPSVFIDLDAKTWKTRGRIFYDVKGSLSRKLHSAGFKIARNREDLHNWILSVRYREEKGAAYGSNKYGTVLRATFSLFRGTTNMVWRVTLTEHSDNSVSGIPPYLDVIQKLDSNPYYFFIGMLLKKYIEHDLLAEGALRNVLHQIALQYTNVNISHSETYISGDAAHFMSFSEEYYFPFAMVRSIKELVRLKDRQSIPVLTHLIHYPIKQVRDEARKALRVFNAS